MFGCKLNLKFSLKFKIYLKMLCVNAAPGLKTLANISPDLGHTAWIYRLAWHYSDDESFHNKFPHLWKH